MTKKYTPDYNKLPDVLWLMILHFLSAGKIVEIRSLSQNFKRIVDSNKIFRVDHSYMSFKEWTILNLKYLLRKHISDMQRRIQKIDQQKREEIKSFDPQKSAPFHMISHPVAPIPAFSYHIRFLGDHYNYAYVSRNDALIEFLRNKISKLEGLLKTSVLKKPNVIIAEMKEVLMTSFDDYCAQAQDTKPNSFNCTIS